MLMPTHNAAQLLLHLFAVEETHAGTSYLRLHASYSLKQVFRCYLALLLLHASLDCAQHHVAAAPYCTLHAHTMHTP
jgi:hypothetical protein